MKLLTTTIMMMLIVTTMMMMVMISTAAPSYLRQQAARTNSSSSELSFNTDVREYNNFNVTAYYAWINNPIDNFFILYPQTTNGSCGGYQYTSKAAQAFGCLYATNAGPFVMYQKSGEATCLGNIVSNGTIVQVQELGEGHVNFGLTQDGDFIIGQLNTSQIESMSFEQLVTGFGWLLVQAEDVTDAGGLIAPRTAIGTDASGRLLIFEADGVQDLDWGLTLQQLADWMSSIGAFNAINLDGGGSSVTWYNGTIADKPTCQDVDFECQRAVTTITCVLP